MPTFLQCVDDPPVMQLSWLPFYGSDAFIYCRHADKTAKPETVRQKLPLREMTTTKKRRRDVKSSLISMRFLFHND